MRLLKRSEVLRGARDAHRANRYNERTDIKIYRVNATGPATMD